MSDTLMHAKQNQKTTAVMTRLLDGVDPCGIGSLTFTYLNQINLFCWQVIFKTKNVFSIFSYCSLQSCFIVILVGPEFFYVTFCRMGNGCIIIINSYNII